MTRRPPAGHGLSIAVLMSAICLLAGPALGQDTALLETIPDAAVTLRMDIVIGTDLFGTLSGSDTDTAAATGASTATLFYEPPYTDALVHTLSIDGDPLQFTYLFLFGLVRIDVYVTDLHIENEAAFQGAIEPNGDVFFPDPPLRVTGTVRIVSDALGVDQTEMLDVTASGPVSARIIEHDGVITLDEIELPVLLFVGDPETLPPGVTSLTATLYTDASDLVYRGTTSPSVIGDGNADGTIDLNDYVLFAECMAGPGVPTDLACSLFDFDADDDVDAWDFAEFQVDFEG